MNFSVIVFTAQSISRNRLDTDIIRGPRLAPMKEKPRQEHHIPKNLNARYVGWCGTYQQANGRLHDRRPRYYRIIYRRTFMSMSFITPPTAAQKEMLEILCGNAVVSDNGFALFNSMPPLSEPQKNDLAKIGKIETNVEGEIKTVAGTQYRVTPHGWVKV